MLISNSIRKSRTLSWSLSLPPLAFGMKSPFSWPLEDGLFILYRHCVQVIQREEWNATLQRNESSGFKNVKHFFSRRYKSWKNRLPLSAYTTDVQSEDSYIFFLSTLWYSDEYNKNDETVNLARARFIRACRSIGFFSLSMVG